MSINLDELERLGKAATPAPWVARHRHDNEHLVVFPSGEDVSMLNEQDAALVATARNALPELLARLRAAERVADLVSGLADVEPADFNHAGEVIAAIEAYRATRKSHG